MMVMTRLCNLIGPLFYLYSIRLLEAIIGRQTKELSNMSDIVRICALEQEYSLRLLHLKKCTGTNNCFVLVSPVHIVLLWNVVHLTESMYEFTNVLI